MKMLEKQTLRSIARTLGIGTPRCNRLWDEMQEQMVNDYTCNNLKIAAREKQFQLHRYDTIEMKLLAVLNEEPGFEIHQTDGGKAVAVHQDNRIGAALALMKLYDRRAMLVGAYAPKVTILDHTGGEKKGPATPDEQQAKMKAVLERREKAAVAHVVEKAEIDPEVLDS